MWTIVGVQSKGIVLADIRVCPVHGLDHPLCAVPAGVFKIPGITVI